MAKCAFTQETNKHKHLRSHVKCADADMYTAAFQGGLFKPLLAPDQTEFPMKFSVEQKWLELIAVDKWPKQIALPLWQGSGESN